MQVRGLPAASLTGVAVGGLAVLLAWLAGVGCEAVRGTSACGGGPGLLILLAVLVVLTWAGSVLLRALGVPHAGSTSLLAVGVLAVIVLVFLLGSLDEGWTLVARPRGLGDLLRRVVVGHHRRRRRRPGGGHVRARVVVRRPLTGGGCQRAAAISSAICTVLRAAPLRRLSLLMNSARPRSSGTPGSWRSRPT